MREILFRGKRIDGEWVEGDLLNGGIDFDTAIRVYDAIGGGSRVFAVDPETVGQYTGLKDKNGKRIFEGDIVRIVERGMVSNGGIVMFENAYPGGWLIGNNKSESKCSLAMRTDVEVIGNIHDNPELMEVR